jgi:hypothetical protein
MRKHLVRMNPKSLYRQVGRDPITSLMPRGAGFVFFVVTANRATLAKAEIQEMSGSKRDACAGGKEIVSDLDRARMGMTMSVGIGAKEQKGQSQAESKRHPKSTMLQVTAKQGGAGN